MQVLLDPSNTESAVQLVTKVDGPNVSLQVTNYSNIYRKVHSLMNILNTFRLVRRSLIYSRMVISDLAVKKRWKPTAKAATRSSPALPSSVNNITSTIIQWTKVTRNRKMMKSSLEILNSYYV